MFTKTKERHDGNIVSMQFSTLTKCTNFAHFGCRRRWLGQTPTTPPMFPNQTQSTDPPSLTISETKDLMVIPWTEWCLQSVGHVDNFDKFGQIQIGRSRHRWVPHYSHLRQTSCVDGGYRMNPS